MTCKECIHFDVCEALESNGIPKIYPSQCGCYKPKSRFIELPCEVGQTVWVIRSKTSNDKNLYLREEQISHYRIFKNGSYMCFESERLSVSDYLWKPTVYLTKEEAEKALAERNKK
jgi:hypothetical protein